MPCSNLLMYLVELRGIEPRSFVPLPNASATHTRAQTPHIHALRPARSPHETPRNAPTIHEQHTAVHGERAWSVHADPDLAAVIAAWPTLPAALRAAMLRLIETGEVGP
jgi:hypothetical protein